MNRFRQNSGFTLMELLVVVALMAIILGGIGIYRLNDSPAGRLESGVRLLNGVAARARVHAMNSGDATRMVIDYDKDSPAFLRRVGVVEEVDGNWFTVGQTLTLPKGIAVVPANSSVVDIAWSDRLSVFSNTGEAMTVDIDGRGSRSFVYVEFSANGDPNLFNESQYLDADVSIADSLPIVYLSFFERFGPEPTDIMFENSEQLKAIRINPKGDAMVVTQ